jgi:hypothetical protein
MPAVNCPSAVVVASRTERATAAVLQELSCALMVFGDMLENIMGVLASEMSETTQE